MSYLLMVYLVILRFSQLQDTRAQQFGIIQQYDGSGVPFSHLYDTRQWFGKSVDQVCESLNNARDLLLIATSSACITPRFAPTIQRPILFIPPDVPVEGCVLSRRGINNQTFESNSGFDNIIPIELNGIQPAELVHSLVTKAFEFENVILVHVCDRFSYCGQRGLEEAVKKLHTSYRTTVQCSVLVVNETEFSRQLDTCVKSLNILSILQRRLLIILHTNLSLIPPSITVLNNYQLLSVETKTIFIVPPNYPVSDLDFAQIKDRDDISIVRWKGEAWVAAITQRTADRYSHFWGENIDLSKSTPLLQGILSRVSSSPVISRMIVAQEPYSVMPTEMCANNGSLGSRQLNLVSDDISKTISCIPNFGSDVCTSYVITSYDVDPETDVAGVQTSFTWSTRNGERSFQFQRDNVNLRGRRIRVAVILSPPFLRRNTTTSFNGTSGNDTDASYEGVVPNMLKTLAKALNFRYELIFPQDGEEYYGKRDKNGTWNGLLGMIQRNEVDMIAADVTISAQRRDDVDFTVPFYEDSLTVLLPRSQFDKSPFTFLYPFSRTVWFCVLAAVALSGPLLYFFSRLSPYYTVKGRRNYFASISEAYMYCYGSIVSQGGMITPDADSSRIFMISWWLFGICTVATYSGNLIAFLTFPGKLTFVDNFDEFVYVSNIQPIIERNSYMETLFSTAGKRSYQDAWSKVTGQGGEAGLVYSYKEAVERVSRNKAGYIGALSKMMATIAQDSFDEGPCQYALLRHPLEKLNYAFAFKKNTNYATLFSKWIRRMSYAGLIEHWIAEEFDRHHQPKRCQEELEHPPDQIRTVSIDDVMGVYFCLGCGVLLASLIFVCEYMSRLSGRFWARTATLFRQKFFAKKYNF